MNKLIALQLVYLAVGMGCNAVSFFLIRRGRQPLAPTRLGLATVLFGIYAAGLGIGAAGNDVIYRLIMAIFVVIGAWMGIASHILRGYSPNGYFSRGSWCLAIGVNLFGLVLNVIGVIYPPHA